MESKVRENAPSGIVAVEEEEEATAEEEKEEVKNVAR